MDNIQINNFAKKIGAKKTDIYTGSQFIHGNYTFKIPFMEGIDIYFTQTDHVHDEDISHKELVFFFIRAQLGFRLGDRFLLSMKLINTHPESVFEMLKGSLKLILKKHHEIIMEELENHIKKSYF